MATNSVSGETQIASLRRWRVKEVLWKNGTHTRHVYGHDVTNDAGLASSPIAAFNVETMVATTHSGTQYTLVGAPGHSRAGDYVWERWCRMYSIVSERDVTDEYTGSLFRTSQDGAGKQHGT